MNIVKLSLLLKEIYECNAIPDKIPIAFFITKLEKKKNTPKIYMETWKPKESWERTTKQEASHFPISSYAVKLY